MSLLEKIIQKIEPLDESAARIAAAHLDNLTKPRGSLGYLEHLVCKYAAIRHDPNFRDGSCEIAVLVSDHGVAAEGVSAYPQSVTVEMLRNIAGGGAAISVLARHYGFKLTIVDVGVLHDTSNEHLRDVIYRRIAPGTRNLAREAAMTRDECRAALEVGIEIAEQAAQSGVTAIGIGEMGIANSTSAAALLCAIAGAPAREMTGFGAGLNREGWERKVSVIERALDLHRECLRAPLEMLAALGGFEIAAMAGICLGGAASRLCVMVDGFIATAAAAAADRICPGLRKHLMFSHQSAEGGHALALKHLEARPILDLGLRLGEGTGAAIAITMLQTALRLAHEMATFEGAGVSEKLGE